MAFSGGNLLRKSRQIQTGQVGSLKKKDGKLRDGGGVNEIPVWELGR